MSLFLVFRSRTDPTKALTDYVSPGNEQTRDKGFNALLQVLVEFYEIVINGSLRRHAVQLFYDANLFVLEKKKGCMQRIEYGLALRSLTSKNLMRKAPETVVGLVHSQPEDYIKYPRKGPRQTSEKKWAKVT